MSTNKAARGYDGLDRSSADYDDGEKAAALPGAPSTLACTRALPHHARPAARAPAPCTPCRAPARGPRRILLDARLGALVAPAPSSFEGVDTE
jgi:hypothetical protein